MMVGGLAWKGEDAMGTESFFFTTLFNAVLIAALLLLLRGLL